MEKEFYSKYYCEIRKEMLLHSQRTIDSNCPEDIKKLYSDIYAVYYRFMKSKDPEVFRNEC